MTRSSPIRMAVSALVLCSSEVLCFTVQQRLSAPSSRKFGLQLSSPTQLYVGTNFDNNNGDNKPSSEDMQMMITDAGVKIAAVALFGFILINTLSFAASLTTAAFSALFDEIGRELINLFSLLGNIFLGVMSGIFGLVKVAAPAIGKGAVAAGKAAAPVIESTVKTIGEAAAPIVQDVTEQISLTTAPYVQPVMEAVDSSIKDAADSVSSSVDATIVAPLRGVATSLTDSVNTAVDSSIREATRAVEESIVVPINAAKESVTSAVDSTIKGVTDNAIAAVDGAMKGAADVVTGK
ncbi:hypothetical protein ACHAXM_007552 [Skeletonema potamos]